MPGELEDFLLGKEMLASLGIDVDRDLEMMASQSQYDEPDEFDEPEVSSTAELSDELEKLVPGMVEGAGRRGFPKEYLDELLRIAVRFDLWREKLSNDPPPCPSPTNENQIEDGCQTLQVQGKEVSAVGQSIHGGLQSQTSRTWVDL